MSSKENPFRRNLICGCRRCGCLCAEHSPTGVEHPCQPHAGVAVARFVCEESARLVAVALFVAVVLSWAAVLQSI